MNYWFGCRFEFELNRIVLHLPFGEKMVDSQEIDSQDFFLPINLSPHFLIDIEMKNSKSNSEQISTK